MLVTFGQQIITPMHTIVLGTGNNPSTISLLQEIQGEIEVLGGLVGRNFHLHGTGRGITIIYNSISLSRINHCHHFLPFIQHSTFIISLTSNIKATPSPSPCSHTRNQIKTKRPTLYHTDHTLLHPQEFIGSDNGQGWLIIVSVGRTLFYKFTSCNTDSKQHHLP